MLVSQRKFAKMIGRSHNYVNKLVKQGVIPTHNGKILPDEAKKAIEEHKDPSRDAQRAANEKRRKEPDLFAPEMRPEKSIADLTPEERKEYEKKLQEEKKKIEQLKEEAKSVGVELGDFDKLLGTMNLNQARTISEIFNAKIKEVTYKKEIGELVPVKQVEKEAFEAARMVRDSFLSLPDRVSSVLIGKSKDEIKGILHQEIIQILENLL